MPGQTFAVFDISLRSIPQRWAPSLVIVVGLAGVVAVFIALLAMANGFETTLKATGRADVAIIMRGGSDTELNSALDADSTNIIKQSPGIRADTDHVPLASAEMQIIAELIRKEDIKSGANITVRGVEPRGFALRPQLKIVSGRTFTPGLRELIVGRGVLQQFQGVEVGRTLRMRGSDWTIVGTFQSEDAYDSELWTDINVVRTTFHRDGATSVVALLDEPNGLETLRRSVAADPRLAVDVVRQQDYFSDQTKQFRATVGYLAGIVTVIMGLGATFAAINTMYAVVSARTREMATLRAIGFSGTSVMVSVVGEALMLASTGGLLGALIAYVVFNNASVSTLGQNFTQVVFSFRISAALVAQGLAIALAIGLLGGVPPAVRATRVPVAVGLREQ